MKLHNDQLYKMKGVLSILLVILIFSSCEEYPQYEFIETNPPKSDFSIETSGLEVTFVNNSSHATKYQWDFGDGNTSTDQSPVHVYGSKNKYVVTLVALDNNDASDEFTSEFEVGFPIAGFEYEVLRSTASFTNTSDNATSYLWNFGDGETSTEKDPVHVYDSKGNYTVSLTVTDGTDESYVEVKIFVPGKFIPTFLAPSFEIDTYRTDWDWNGASSTGSPSPPDGKRGAKFGPDSWIAQTLQVDDNTNYTLKFWFVTKDPAPIGLKVIIMDGDDPNIILLDDSTGPSANDDDYQEVSFTFNTENSSSITVKLMYGDIETRIDLFSIE